MLKSIRNKPYDGLSKIPLSAVALRSRIEFLFRLPSRVTAVVLAVFCLLSLASADPYQKIVDMRDGKATIIKARVGERVLSQETPKTFVFTMRDDFGGTAYAHTRKDISSMRFGATYILKGVARMDPTSKTLYLDVSSWEMAYEVSFGPIFILGGAILVAIIVGTIFFARRLKSVKPSEPWDYAEIMSGPDQGARIPLRLDKIIVGRQQDPEKSIAISQDNFVSRNHGIVTRKNNQTYYEDTNSRAGSFIDEEKVYPGPPVPLPPGAFLRLGPHTTIRIGTAVGFHSETSVFEDDSSPGPGSWQETRTS